jgi:hypothetical protein
MLKSPSLGYKRVRRAGLEYEEKVLTDTTHIAN